MKYQLVCKYCKCIVLEDTEEEEIKKLGEFISCPTCGEISKNPSL
jgi:hypothetical protein